MYQNNLTESLKETIVGDFQISYGREFHRTGPKQLKDSCFIFKRAGCRLYNIGETWSAHFIFTTPLIPSAYRSILLLSYLCIEIFNRSEACLHRQISQSTIPL